MAWLKRALLAFALAITVFASILPDEDDDSILFSQRSHIHRQHTRQHHEALTTLTGGFTKTAQSPVVFAEFWIVGEANAAKQTQGLHAATAGRAPPPQPIVFS